MSGSERDKGILEHIVRYCDQIDATLARFGDEQGLFAEDFVFQNAVAMCLLQIGELTGHLTDVFRRTHAEMPWRQIKALRNIIAHNYGAVDADTAWEIAHEDIPKLKAYCRGVLERL